MKSEGLTSSSFFRNSTAPTEGNKDGKRRPWFNGAAVLLGAFFLEK